MVRVREGGVYRTTYSRLDLPLSMQFPASVSRQRSSKSHALCISLVEYSSFSLMAVQGLEELPELIIIILLIIPLLLILIIPPETADPRKNRTRRRSILM